MVCTAVSAEIMNAATVLPKNCQPVYPPDLRRAGIEGKVTVVAVVDEKGDVIEATVAKESEVEPWQFRYSAVVAVWQWKFRPAMRDGRPVKCRILCPLEFSLQGAGGH